MRMKNGYQNYFKRLLILFVGLTIAHLGVTLFLLADLGADPFNVFVQGIFRTLSDESMLGLSFLSHGYTHVGICFLIIIVLLFVDKTYIKIGTVLCMVCGGPIIDFFSYILAPVFEGMTFWLKLIMLALGCVILACGMTIVIKSEAGTGPNDLVAVVISDKSGRKFSLIRIIVDVSFVAIGFCLGGILGIGTIICAFLVGPVAGIFMPRSEKLVKTLMRFFMKENPA
jgi:uncharacterized membrane protein YczE